jgi:hypothetical protein
MFDNPYIIDIKSLDPGVYILGISRANKRAFKRFLKE